MQVIATLKQEKAEALRRAGNAEGHANAYAGQAEAFDGLTDVLRGNYEAAQSNLHRAMEHASILEGLLADNTQAAEARERQQTEVMPSLTAVYDTCFAEQGRHLAVLQCSCTLKCVFACREC